MEVLVANGIWHALVDIMVPTDASGAVDWLEISSLQVFLWFWLTFLLVGGTTRLLVLAGAAYRQWRGGSAGGADQADA